MKTKSFEEVRKALLVAKESLEENLEELDRLEKEEETITLRIKPERERAIAIPQAELCPIDEGAIRIKERIVIDRRCSGPLVGKAFYLNDAYDWQVGRDDVGILCLVPIKKWK